MSKIRLKHGEHEIELDGSDIFIEKHIMNFYERIGSAKFEKSSTYLTEDLSNKYKKKISGKIPTPAEFYKDKGKTDGVSQILIFGKYLEEYRKKSEFSREDINKLGKEVKLPKNIHSQYFTNAVKQGLLRFHGRGKYSLTLSAESILSAM